MMNTIQYLGIDGGGTKTEFWLTDADGFLLSSCVLGASNPNDVGIDAACALLDNGIAKVTEGYDLATVSVFAGIAGAATGDNAAQLKAHLVSLGFARADAASDVRSALAACLQDEDGIAIIMGTGSVAYAQHGGQLLRAGGYGYLLGDAGSGFALGQGAILAALQAEDGSGVSTLLHDLVSAQCGKARVLDALSDFYRGGKTEIARYAPLIFDAHAKGDAVATEILSRNVDAIADLVRAIGNHMNENRIRVVLCGGLTSQSMHILPLLHDALADDARTYIISISKAAPIQGAIFLASKL